MVWYINIIKKKTWDEELLVNLNSGPSSVSN